MVSQIVSLADAEGGVGSDVGFGARRRSYEVTGHRGEHVSPQLGRPPRACCAQVAGGDPVEQAARRADEETRWATGRWPVIGAGVRSDVEEARRRDGRAGGDRQLAREGTGPGNVADRAAEG